MLHIILMILKILGILIISVLGAILLVGLLIFFWPIRYRFEGSIYGKPEGKGRITWLCRLIQILFSYQEEKVKISVQILGIQLKKRKPKREKKRRKVKTSGAQKKKQEKQQKETKIEKTQVEKITTEKSIETGKAEHAHTKEKTHLSLKKQRQTWRVRLKKILQQKEQVVTFIRDENNRSAFSFAKNRIFKLLCHILPGKIKIRLHYGFDDPAMTGMMTGFFFMFYPNGAKNFELMPDFEQRVLEGETFFSGRVQIFRIAGTLWSVYHHKECNQLFKSIWRE